VGPSGEVHAFEPVPTSAAKLRELQAHFPWIHVHQCAVADQPGEVVLNAEVSSTSPINRIVIQESDLASAGGRIAVPVTTLDSAVAQFGAPALMKIDVEGYE
jgi:FkbM family methyltransferase